ncbi:hypothetical protein [Microbacterium sp. No. 7]|uniref:hypothetical protein n=1 Tax=Microbacterium sp. No. 7 TaxID=1714373 RepID=UPI0006ED3F63|nr:hypothetical protein [Microbacterium sp. No. 7]ALJ19519.1 hypothetical protein AOA12_06195 [Microbacterium sp. No. 7]
MTDYTRTATARRQAIENRRQRALKRGALTLTRNGSVRSMTAAPSLKGRGL